ncbi:uncharacterized protein LOC116096213 isoform X2 [Mastomys coucha]|uniref:uncharacterized protein LOC116096213 isoform X2 n=1 Tax=Mastomys coucha TaxID=35658 RepID=UPI00126175E2|nr:uncharacterized protein LOC116096213 isoform X2 [Mastomys coucha]
MRARPGAEGRWRTCSAFAPTPPRARSLARLLNSAPKAKAAAAAAAAAPGPEDESGACAVAPDTRASSLSGRREGVRAGRSARGGRATEPGGARKSQSAAASPKPRRPAAPHWNASLKGTMKAHLGPCIEDLRITGRRLPGASQVLHNHEFSTEMGKLDQKSKDLFLNQVYTGDLKYASRWRTEPFHHRPYVTLLTTKRLLYQEKEKENTTRNSPGSTLNKGISTFVPFPFVAVLISSLLTTIKL